MKLFVLILQNVEMMQPILEKLERRGMTGATLLDCKGAASALENYMAGSFLGSLRAVLEPAREHNEMMISVVEDNMVQMITDTIAEFVDLNEPYQGVAFTVPVDMTLGIKRK